MRYEIINDGGIWCVFKNDRIISAFESLREAKEAVERYKKGARK